MKARATIVPLICVLLLPGVALPQATAPQAVSQQSAVTAPAPASPQPASSQPISSQPVSSQPGSPQPGSPDATCLSCNNDSTNIVVNNPRPPARKHQPEQKEPSVINEPQLHSQSVTVDVSNTTPKPDKEKGPLDKPKANVNSVSDLLWTLLKLILVALVAWIVLSFVLALYFPAIPQPNRWIVWSVRDKTESGAEGAVIAALNNSINPLVAPYIQTDPLKAAEAGRRRQFLLAPPFVEEAVSLRSIATTVWPDFLGSGNPIAFIEKIPFDAETCPQFVLDQVYEDIDIKVGSYEVKGVMALFRIYKRLYFRQIPQVVGYVAKVPNSGSESGKANEGGKSGDTWEVRLNANLPTPLKVMETDFVSSVWADGDNSDQGDKLGLVSQRAAFKLTAAISDAGLFNENESQLARGSKRSYDINQIHALAYYRQGIDMLLQLL